MQNIYDLIDDVAEKADDLVHEMTEVNNLRLLGLDPRAAARVWISDDAIAVRAGHGDRTLQYYGGFEYVDSEYRKELGDYVFYLAEDGRVQDHLDQYNGVEDEDEEE